MTSCLKTKIRVKEHLDMYRHQLTGQQWAQQRSLQTPHHTITNRWQLYFASICVLCAHVFSVHEKLRGPGANHKVALCANVKVTTNSYV